jgi:putative endonuclease
MCYYVYILYSESIESYYKGQTNDLADRIQRHNHKHEKATQHGAPWTLVWSIKLNTRSEAVILEQKLKNLSKERLRTFMKKYKNGLPGK